METEVFIWTAMAYIIAALGVCLMVIGWGWLFKRRSRKLITNKLTAAFERGECIDCGNDKFLLGPRAGICQNVECTQCGHRFNVSTVKDFPFAERTSHHDLPS